MLSKKIEPRVLKGFRDYLPKEASIRRSLFSKISSIFETHGFSPIETPALEYSEILLGKGSDETDKQMFRFNDQGGRDVSLRFDLTVPLARFVSEHQNDLIFPFKRSHIGTVWRAEKPQKGRYREFTQCDFDIIGSQSSMADSEVLLVAASFFKSLNVPFLIKINHRVILSEIINYFNISNKRTEALRAIDKLEKIGKDGVLTELIKETGIESDKAIKLVDLLIKISQGKTSSEVFNLITSEIKPTEELTKAIDGLGSVFKAMLDSGHKEDDIKLDITIARGLDYYTGIVFETQLKQIPKLGSVCSGGRYDDLANLYTSRKLPGVGGSIGIDRLLVGLDEIGELAHIKNERKGILIANMNDPESFKLLHDLRNVNIQSEIYPDDSKLGVQFKYADKRGIRFVLIKGESEKEKGVVTIKDLLATDDNSKQFEVNDNDLVNKVIELVG